MSALQAAIAEREALTAKNAQPQPRAPWKGVTALRAENEQLHGIISELKTKATARPSAPSASAPSRPATMRAAAVAPAPAATSPDSPQLHGIARVTAAFRRADARKAIRPSPSAPIASTAPSAADIAREIIAQQQAEDRQPTGIARTAAAFKAAAK